MLYEESAVRRRPAGNGDDLERIGPYVEAERERLRRIYVAMMLSPTIEVCEALLRGESVPPSAVDPVWARRFGLEGRAT
jgi:hypothetical protein